MMVLLLLLTLLPPAVAVTAVAAAAAPVPIGSSAANATSVAATPPMGWNCALHAAPPPPPLLSMLYSSYKAYCVSRAVVFPTNAAWNHYHCAVNEAILRNISRLYTPRLVPKTSANILGSRLVLRMRDSVHKLSICIRHRQRFDLKGGANMDEVAMWVNGLRIVLCTDII